jgi:hypothetical protein
MAGTSNRMVLTLRYMFHVNGYYKIPEKSFPSRMGCHHSDMFRVSFDHKQEYFEDGISLSEFHAAFLCSPLFQLELWLLSKFGMFTNIDPITTTTKHLQGVASGDHSSFGPWTTWAVDGSRSRLVSTVDEKILPDTTSTSSTVTPCVIMRCRTRQGPFCDSWWALEMESDDGQPSRRHPQLVFGTSLLKDYHNSMLIRVMTPLHRFYSRLLLANCKATLVHQYRMKHHQR